LALVFGLMIMIGAVQSKETCVPSTFCQKSCNEKVLCGGQETCSCTCKPKKCECGCVA